MPFRNEILSGTALVRTAIKSPNYIVNVSGWSINKDGSAEFASLIARGTIVIKSGGALEIYDANGVLRITSFISGSNAQIRFPTGSAQETSAMGIFDGLFSTTPNQRIDSVIKGANLGNGSIRLVLYGWESAAKAALFQLDSLSMTPALPVYVDFTCNDAAGAATGGIVAASDFWIGTSNNFGIPPTKVVSLPRGKHAYFNSAVNDTGGARAAGVNTDMVITPTVNNTRLYEVTLKCQFNVGTAAVVYAVNLSDGGTVGANDGTVIDRFDRWSAADTPAGSLTVHSSSTILYAPASSGAKTLRVRNDAGSGGTLLGIGGANIQRHLFIKDIGEQ